MFHVGQKVVCILDNWAPYPGVTFPKKRQVYAIRDILGFGHAATGLRFMEILNPDAIAGIEHCFDSKCFRPLIERSTEAGFAVLKRLLDPSHQKIEERAR